jgi:hypothetical protein
VPGRSFRSQVVVPTPGWRRLYWLAFKPCGVWKLAVVYQEHVGKLLSDAHPDSEKSVRGWVMGKAGVVYGDRICSGVGGNLTFWGYFGVP